MELRLACKLPFVYFKRIFKPNFLAKLDPYKYCLLIVYIYLSLPIIILTILQMEINLRLCVAKTDKALYFPFL